MTAGEFIVIAVAVLVGAGVKAVTGLGLPIVAIPAMALFIPVEDAVVIIAVPNAIMNLFLVFGVRSRWEETRDIPALSVWGVVGAVVGTFVLVSVPEEPLLLLLAVVVIVYIVTSSRREGLAISPAQSKRLAPGVGLGAGLMQGAVGISGPVLATWLHAYRLERNVYVLSITTIFLLGGIAQIAVLGATGRLWGTPLWLGLAATVPILATVPAGAAVRDRVAGPTFDRIVMVMLAASAIGLLVRVFG